MINHNTLIQQFKFQFKLHTITIHIIYAQIQKYKGQYLQNNKNNLSKKSIFLFYILFNKVIFRHLS